jgi:hypothetical protein
LFGFRILAIDFHQDLLDLGIGIRHNEMSEEISKAEQVAETTNRVVFLGEKSVPEQYTDYLN